MDDKDYYICHCQDCKEDRKRKKIHLEHPFYAQVERVTAQVAKEQILKGADKYPEPFNPASWSNKQLVWHLLQELRDGQVYGVGLLERLEEQEKQINDLTAELMSERGLFQDYKKLYDNAYKRNVEANARIGELLKEVERLKGGQQ